MHWMVPLLYRLLIYNNYYFFTSQNIFSLQYRSQFLLTNFSVARSSTVRPVELVSMLLYCDYLITLYKSSPKTVQRFGKH